MPLYMITWSPSASIEEDCPCNSVANYIIEKFDPILVLTVQNKKVHLHLHSFFTSDRRQDSISRSIETKFGYKKVDYPRLFKVQKWKTINEAYRYMCKNMYEGGSVIWDKGNNFIENIYPVFLERLEDQQEIVPISRRELISRILSLQDPTKRMSDYDFEQHLRTLIVQEHLDVLIHTPCFHLVKMHVNVTNGHQHALWT